jgi:hypothetical protein
MGIDWLRATRRRIADLAGATQHRHGLLESLSPRRIETGTRLNILRNKALGIHAGPKLLEPVTLR